jgi:hypothetical protein
VHLTIGLTSSHQFQARQLWLHQQKSSEIVHELTPFLKLFQMSEQCGVSSGTVGRFIKGDEELMPKFKRTRYLFMQSVRHGMAPRLQGKIVPDRVSLVVRTAVISCR